MKTLSVMSVFGILVFAGCSSLRPPDATVTPEFPGIAKEGGVATLVVAFDDWRPATVNAHVLLDGEEKAIIRARRWTEFKVPSGRRKIDILFSVWTSLPSREIILDCAPGDKRYLIYTLSPEALQAFSAVTAKELKIVKYKQTGDIVEMPRKAADIWFNGYEFVPPK
jgi:hypothetical protein